MKVRISLEINEEILEKINRASKIDCRSRSSFIQKASKDMAEKILNK